MWGWYQDIVAAVDEVTAGGEVPASGARAYDQLKQAVARTAAEDPSSLPAQASGSLSIDEVVSNVAVLLFGGIVTTEATTSTLLHYLLADPDNWTALRDDRTLIGAAVEEALRFEPAAAVVDRYATRDSVLGRATIASGDLVRVSLSAPNRDPDLFPDPDQFDIRRANAGQHVTFARGPHACLGIHLARLETSIAVESLLVHLPDLQMDSDGAVGPEGLIFRGPPSVSAIW